MEYTELIKQLSPLGIGGLLAAFIFAYYRKDVKQFTELWKASADQFMEIVKDNTASNVKLITMIENQERNFLRKSDIETLIDRHFSNHP